MKASKIKYTIITLICLSILGCGSSKDAMPDLVKNPPFVIEKASFNSWVSGVKGGGSGISVKLNFKDLDTSKIQLDSIYFRQRIAPIKAHRENYKATFKGERNTMDEFILHRDSEKEYGNKPPVAKEYQFPFELSENEAVISYYYKKELHYVALILEEEKTDKYN